MPDFPCGPEGGSHSQRLSDEAVVPPKNAHIFRLLHREHCCKGFSLGRCWVTTDHPSKSVTPLAVISSWLVAVR